MNATSAAGKDHLAPLAEAAKMFLPLLMWSEFQVCISLVLWPHQLQNDFEDCDAAGSQFWLGGKNIT